MIRQNLPEMREVGFRFPHDPITVLAGDGQPMHHHRLTATENRSGTALVELLGELVVNEHGGVRKIGPIGLMGLISAD
jgi:hypothetical protein